MANVLITGGAGFVGSMVVRQLLAAGHRVRIVDNLMHGGNALLDLWGLEEVDVVVGDVCEPEVRAREPEMDIWRDYSPGAMYAKPSQPEPEPKSPESAAGEAPRAAAAKGGEIPEFPIPPVDAIPGQRFQFSPRPSPTEGAARAEIPVEETANRSLKAFVALHPLAGNHD